MIRPNFAFKLARTKLHSKRVMTFAAIAISSVLFAALVALSCVFSGAENSAQEFVKQTGGDRFLVKVSPNFPDEAQGIYRDLTAEKIREIRTFEKKYYADLRAKYESLGLEYDEKSEVSALSPVSWMSNSIPEDQRVTINQSSPVIAALNEQKLADYAKTATNKFADLQKIGEKYGASGFYIAAKNSFLEQIPAQRLIQNGKEDFGDSELKSGDMSTHGYYTNAIHNGNYAFSDQKLLERYLLTTDANNLRGIPVVVSAQEAAKLFGNEIGIGDEPENSSEKIAWLKDLQTKINGKTYQVCYRNSAEQVLLEKIQRDYAEIKSNANNPDYEEPHLQYDYPSEACGEIVVKKDVRTTSEKFADEAAENVQKKLGEFVAPQHKLLTFQIVGVRYSQAMGEQKSISDYAKSVLAPQDDSMSLEIPLQMYSSLPESLKFDDIVRGNGNSSEEILTSDDFAPRVLEFSSVDAARDFLKNETCSSFDSDCDKKFLGAAYGSNYLIFDDTKALFSQTSSTAFIIILALATLIIWFTISRIMAENRKETAVYRAMGARRSDILAIYMVYTFNIALRIACLSLIIGALAAFAIDGFYGKELTNVAAATFGIVDKAPRFNLLSLNLSAVSIIVGSIFVASFIASIQPLIRNTHRSPINDLREE